MQIIVIRGDGNKEAPDLIVDPLCTTEQIGSLRGRKYLYDVGFDIKHYEVTVPYRTPLVCSKLIGIQDTGIGESFIGRLVSFNISGNVSDTGLVTIQQDIHIERKLL